jgi:hypothetical protein
MSSRDSGRPLVDLMRNNDEADTNGSMNDEPADVRADEDYSFFKYYDCFGCRKHR